MVANSYFKVDAVLQAVIECPLCRWAGIFFEVMSSLPMRIQCIIHSLQGTRMLISVVVVLFPGLAVMFATPDVYIVVPLQG